MNEILNIRFALHLAVLFIGCQYFSFNTVITGIICGTLIGLTWALAELNKGEKNGK